MPCPCIPPPAPIPPLPAPDPPPLDEEPRVKKLSRSALLGARPCPCCCCCGGAAPCCGPPYPAARIMTSALNRGPSCVRGTRAITCDKTNQCSAGGLAAYVTVPAGSLAAVPVGCLPFAAQGLGQARARLRPRGLADCSDLGHLVRQELQYRTQQAHPLVAAAHFALEVDSASLVACHGSAAVGC